MKPTLACLLTGLSVLLCACPSPRVEDPLTGNIALIFLNQDDKNEVETVVRQTLQSAVAESGIATTASLSEISGGDDSDADVIRLRKLAYDAVSPGNYAPYRARYWVQTTKEVVRIDIHTSERKGQSNEPVKFYSLGARSGYRWPEGEEPDDNFIIDPFTGGEQAGQNVVYRYEVDIGGDKPDPSGRIPALLLPRKAKEATITVHYADGKKETFDDVDVQEVEPYEDAMMAPAAVTKYAPKNENGQKMVAVIQPRLELYAIYELAMDRRAYGLAYAALTSTLAPKDDDPRAITGVDGDMSRWYLFEDLRLINVLLAQQNLPPEARRTTLVRYTGPQTITSSSRPEIYVALDREGTQALQREDGQGRAEFVVEPTISGGNVWRIVDTTVNVKLPKEDQDVRRVFVITRSGSGTPRAYEAEITQGD